MANGTLGVKCFHTNMMFAHLTRNMSLTARLRGYTRGNNNRNKIVGASIAQRVMTQIRGKTIP